MRLSPSLAMLAISAAAASRWAGSPLGVAGRGPQVVLGGAVVADEDALDELVLGRLDLDDRRGQVLVGGRRPTSPAALFGVVVLLHGRLDLVQCDHEQTDHNRGNQALHDSSRSGISWERLKTLNPSYSRRRGRVQTPGPVRPWVPVAAAGNFPRCPLPGVDGGQFPSGRVQSWA